MKIYTLAKRFDSRTGKEIEPELIETSKLICDFTGVVWDWNKQYDLKPLYTVSIEYDHGCEPEWYYDDGKAINNLLKYIKIENKLDDDYQIKAKLFEGEYHFFGNGSGADNLGPLMKEWITNIQKKKGPFKDCAHFAHVLRTARMKVVLDILKEKKFTLQELGLI